MAPFKVKDQDDTHAVCVFTCPCCGKEQELRAPIEGVKKYLAGALVQNAFPTMPASERELFVSGMCDDCFPS